jgi:hypothetical protein
MRTALSALLILGNVLLFGGCSTRSTEVTPEPSGAGGPTDCPGSDTSTDPSNCGTCGHSCLGGGCSNGACQPFVFARGVDRVTNLAMDASAIYAAFWRATPRPLGCSNEAWVSRFDRATNAQTTVVPCGTVDETNLWTVNVTNGAVYWNDTTDPTNANYHGLLTRTDVATGIATRFPDANGAYTIAVDDQHVYYWDGDLIALARANLDGSGATAIGPTGWSPSSSTIPTSTISRR